MTTLRQTGYGHDAAHKGTIALAPRQLTINGQDVEVRVSRSPQARVARIIVGPRRPLEAVVPAGMTMKELDRFLVSKRTWIGNKLAAVDAIVSRPHQLGLDRPNTLWFGGDPHAVEWLRGTRAVARLVDAAAVVVGGVTEVEAVAALERLYRREASRRLRLVVEREAMRLKLAPAAVAVRDQKTRWGSCSRNGNLSFSWRLVIAPERVLEYVVVHELCHLREPSHSKRYWQILETAFPDWRKPARWLRENGQELHGYEPRLDRTTAGSSRR